MASPLGLSRATQLQAESAHDYYSVGYNSSWGGTGPTDRLVLPSKNCGFIFEALGNIDICQ